MYKHSCSKPTRKNLTCKSGEHIVGTSEILIDGKIEKVRDFICHTKDLKHLFCSFKQSYNLIPNNYTLSYTINNEEVGRRIKRLELFY